MDRREDTARRIGLGLVLCLVLGVALPAERSAAEDEETGDGGFTTLFDFEQGTFEGWEVTGKAFGEGPLEGSAPRQQRVTGYLGRRLANSYVAGDGPRGRMRSRPFVIDRPYMRLLVGGGSQGVAAILEVDGKPRFGATGEESEQLTWRCWDLRALRGKRARIVAVDESEGWWGHLLLDHVQLLDAPDGPVVSMGVKHRIYDPSAGEKGPWYVNDHCVVRHTDGKWHLIGITHAEPAAPLDEVLFCHATASRLTHRAWTKRPPVLRADPDAGEEHIWAPHVVLHGGTYHMFYCAGTSDHEHYRIHLATSRDLTSWKRHEANPLFTDGYDARDPFVLRARRRWLLYYTATSERSGGHHVVKVRTSDDLVAWSEPSIAFRDPAVGTIGGPTESPFVLKRGGWFYLFLGPRGGYVGTDVFRSRDPFNFGIEDRVGHLHAHAAEVVRDRDGRWYVTHCGWKQGGVWLAPLHWADGLDG